MINKKIAIAVLARDCNEALQRNIPRVEQLRSYFGESGVVVVENDSKDGTKETLQKWAQSSNNVAVISNDYGTATISASTNKDPYPEFGLGRIEKMARYRNIYMDYIRENFSEVHYVIMLDIDVLYFDAQGVVDSINGAPQDWQALFAFGRMYRRFRSEKVMTLAGYYDMFAYTNNDTKFPITRKSILSGRKELTKQIKQVNYCCCTSAFGGLGVYKWQSINTLSYRAELNDDTQVRVLCEHIPFNRHLSGLYIARDMVLVYNISSRLETIKKWLVPKFLRKKLRIVIGYLKGASKK
ncbi:MAG: hypothetical protein R3Y49_05365 [Rikenellaceae bacterium]